MVNPETTTGTPKISKKEFRKAVVQRMEAALEEYKKELGEKRFETRIRKASKLFSRDWARINKKNDRKAKKEEVPAAEN